MKSKEHAAKMSKQNGLKRMMLAAAACVLILAGAAGCGKKDSAERPTAETVQNADGIQKTDETQNADAMQKTDETQNADGRQKDTEVQQIRIGSLLALGTVTPFVSRELGYFDEVGLNAEIIEFSDGAALMEAFATGELDLALVGIIPAAAWYSRGIELQVIAASNGGGHVVMIRSDSDIASVEDLKGKLVAEPSVATVTDALLRSRILKDAGLQPDADVTLIAGTKPADMPTALMATKEVDAIVTWEPYAAIAQAEYGDAIRVLYNASEEIKTDGDYFYPGNVVIASGDLISEYPEIVDQYLEIHRKTVDYMNTDEGANAVISGLLQIEEPVVEQARTRTDFQVDIHESAAMEILNWSLDLGYLEELPDPEQFFRKGTENVEE